MDDDAELCSLLSEFLRREGFTVECEHEGASGLEHAGRTGVDLVVLDVMLPGLDGFEVCRRLRGQTTAPILMLTARDDPMDRVVGLEVGADDYVTKPFSIRELVARINAQLRRATMQRGGKGRGRPPEADEPITVGPLTVDPGRRIATLDGARLPLKRREFDLLAYLAVNAGIVLSRDKLLSEVWADELLGGATSRSWQRQQSEH